MNTCAHINKTTFLPAFTKINENSLILKMFNKILKYLKTLKNKLKKKFQKLRIVRYNRFEISFNIKISQ